MFKPVSACLGWILLTASVCLPAAAHQPASDWARCANEGTAFSLDVQIMACTAVVQSPRETPLNRFIAQHTRLIAHRLKQDCNRAIADYGETIRRDPNSASAYNGRAQIYLKAGMAAAGLPDVRRALELDPNYAAALATRGRIFEALGRRQEAMADFRHVLVIDPKHRASTEALMRLRATREVTARGTTSEPLGGFAPRENRLP